MVKKAKYHARELTEEDKEILDKVALKYAVKFYALKEQYRNPKDYAKEILKRMQSDKDIAGLFILSDLKNYPPDHIFKPREINEKLANDIRIDTQQNYKEMIVEEHEAEKRFLHPRDLREGVLKKFEKEGIFLHLEGKKEIRNHQYKTARPGRKSSSDKVHDDRGGKRSAYIITEEVMKLKKAMEKPGAIDFLHNKVIGSGLAHQLTKFKMLAFLNAAKMNESAIHNMIGAGASFFQDKIGEDDYESFKMMHQNLQLCGDNQLDQYADNMAKSLIEDRGYYALLFIAGLLKY